jgi:hypothetical protein
MRIASVSLEAGQDVKKVLKIAKSKNLQRRKIE